MRFHRVSGLVVLRTCAHLEGVLVAKNALCWQQCFFTHTVFTGSPPWAFDWKKHIGKIKREPNNRPGCNTAVTFCLCLNNYT